MSKAEARLNVVSRCCSDFRRVTALYNLPCYHYY